MAKDCGTTTSKSEASQCWARTTCVWRKPDQQRASKSCGMKLGQSAGLLCKTMFYAWLKATWIRREYQCLEERYQKAEGLRQMRCKGGPFRWIHTVRSPKQAARVVIETTQPGPKLWSTLRIHCVRPRTLSRSFLETCLPEKQDSSRPMAFARLSAGKRKPPAEKLSSQPIQVILRPIWSLGQLIGMPKQAKKQSTTEAPSGNTLRFCQSNRSSEYSISACAMNKSWRSTLTKKPPTRANQWLENTAPKGGYSVKQKPLLLSNSCTRRLF